MRRSLIWHSFSCHMTTNMKWHSQRSAQISLASFFWNRIEQTTSSKVRLSLSAIPSWCRFLETIRRCSNSLSTMRAFITVDLYTPPLSKWNSFISPLCCLSTIDCQLRSVENAFAFAWYHRSSNIWRFFQWRAQEEGTHPRMVPEAFYKHLYVPCGIDLA